MRCLYYDIGAVLIPTCFIHPNVCSQVVKMQKMVTYPLYNLDMGEYIPFKDPETCHLYDLYGVVVSEIYDQS